MCVCVCVCVCVGGIKVRCSFGVERIQKPCTSRIQSRRSSIKKDLEQLTNELSLNTSKKNAPFLVHKIALISQLEQKEEKKMYVTGRRNAMRL